MVLCVFMLDTSASMNQRAHTGMSYLDTAKHAVDSWMKVCDNILCVHTSFFPFSFLFPHLFFDLMRPQRYILFFGVHACACAVVRLKQRLLLRRSLYSCQLKGQCWQ